MTDIREPAVGGLDAAESAPRRRRWTPRRAVAAGVAVVVVLAVAAAVFVLRPSSAGSDEITADQRAAMRAAGNAVVDLISYRRASFDADYRRALAGTTGKLRSDMAAARKQTLQTMDAGRFDLAARLDATALVPAASGSGTNVLVVVSGWTVDNAGKRSAPKVERVQMTMTKVDGRWLAGNLRVPDGVLRDPSSGSEQDRVLTAATTCLAAMNTYDYHAVAAAKKRALACTSGPFTAHYATSFDTVTAAAVKARTSQTFEVTGAGLQSLTSDTARLLVVGQMETTTNGKHPQYGLLSLTVTLHETDGAWKVTGYRTTP